MSAVRQELEELRSRTTAISTRDADDEHGQRVRWYGHSEPLATLGRSLSSLQSRYITFQKTQRIFASLHFRQIGERRNEIPVAHRSTYDWVFEGQVSSFSDWLEQSTASIYWIAGKAGSGKSTLMKHIHTHPRMRTGLLLWAGVRQLLVASHFFWGAGTLLQQTQEGLLRTLMFQILTQHPELTPRSSPARWDAAFDQHGITNQQPWTSRELLDGLVNLLTGNTSCCTLIFVDGLDEYSGELDSLIQMISTLGRIANVKLCISSRPWPRFSEVFSDSPWKLCLQDLTRADIERYTMDTLEAQSRFKLLQARDPNTSHELVSSITDRAQGVFLWVYLVVRSLIRGLVNADSMGDLQRRLDELPRQLEPFFERILNTVDELYKCRTSRVLLVLAHARIPLPLVTFYFLDSEEDLPFNPHKFLRNWPYVNEEEAEAIEKRKRQLIAQFKDLISLTEHPTKAAMFSFSVGFIHRTVIEYLNQGRIQEWMYSRAGPAFDPVTALFMASFEQFETLSHLWKRTYLRPYLSNWFLSSIYYAREIEVTRGKPATSQLDQIEKILSKNLEYTSFSDAIEQVCGSRKFESMESLAMCMGLYLYMKEKRGSIKAEEALEPQFCIEFESDFLVREVTGLEREMRCVVDTGKPVYSSTLHMFTASEAEHLSLVRVRRDQQQPPGLPLNESVATSSEDGIRRVSWDPLTFSTSPEPISLRVSRFKKIQSRWHKLIG